MQNPRQPLGKFPREIVQNIARQDPQAYARLAQVDRRLRNTVRPALSQVCQESLNGKDIINGIIDEFANSAGEFNVYLDGQGRTVQLGINSDEGLNALKLVIEETIPLNQAKPILDKYLQSGLKPNLVLMSSAYRSRASCRNMNPYYFKPLLREEFLRRLQAITLPEDATEDEILKYLGDRIQLVGDFALALDPDYFIYDNLPDSIDTSEPDYFETYDNQINTEVDRLLALANN